MEDLPDWFSEPTPVPVVQEVPSQWLDATHSLNVSNRTLTLRNHNQGGGWRKDAITTISYANTLNLCTVATSSIHHYVNVSKVLIWLAYEEALFVPLCCDFHLDPFSNCHLHADRITFQFKCSGKCYQEKALSIVVVEYDAFKRYRWHYVDGYFKKFRKPKQAALPDQLPAISVVSNQMQNLMSQLETLNNEVKTLQQLLYVLIQAEQQQQQQNMYARK